MHDEGPMKDQTFVALLLSDQWHVQVAPTKPRVRAFGDKSAERIPGKIEGRPKMSGRFLDVPSIYVIHMSLCAQNSLILDNS
jgi:hypothetical protein